jgi:hypothetical protein
MEPLRLLSLDIPLPHNPGTPTSDEEMISLIMELGSDLTYVSALSVGAHRSCT